MEKGYWLLVLHAHLPFVRHPEYKDPLEERWLYEAIIETYMPLLDMFERLKNENIDFKITMTITPPLANMLSDSLLQERFLRHIEKLIELAEKETIRFRFAPQELKVATHYLNKFKNIHYNFTNKYNRNILKGFKKYQEAGNLEIITCNATHGFLPLMKEFPEAVYAQIITGVKDYKSKFDCQPNGIWLAECGYYRGVEKFLEKANIKYFFTDTHTVLHAENKPKYGVFAPLSTDNGIHYFARDIETSHSVWSSQTGYPGDGAYREFYRDLGFDSEYDYIKPYIHESGIRVQTGLKYHRITSKTIPMNEKEIYDPDLAFNKTIEHANDFVYKRELQIEDLSKIMDRKPVIVSMYDAELFGHWWYEGPDFLYNTLKRMHQSNIVKTILPKEYLNIYPNNQISNPLDSSWGYKGYNEFWLNGTNDWIYPHLHMATKRMIEIAKENKYETNPLVIRVLNQAARELMLAQSSDWAFIMRTNTVVDYATKRTKNHIGRFNQLYDFVKNKRIDPYFLEILEKYDNIFPEIDYRDYC